MSFLLKQGLHTSLAKSIHSDILCNRDSYYYFLGRTLPWGANDLPAEIDDTYSTEADVRNNAIYFNKININDVCFVTKRINWEQNTVYDRFDANYSTINPSSTGATSIYDARYYVVTDELNVYKCINNNGGAVSTIKPTSTSYDIFVTSDGYVWKFMYSISANLQYKFLTPDFMPVTQAIDARYYSNQGIDSVTIVEGGINYEGDPVTIATVIGDGTGATISLNINPSTGSIEGGRIKNSGSGYTTGYIQIVTTDGKGTGKYDGNLTAILIPKFVDGKLVDVVIDDPGINYSTDMQTNIIVDGTGKDAKLHPIVENGKIVDVIIENPGYGYTEVTLSIASITGTGASLSVNTAIGDVDNIQADVELLAVPGAIYVVDAITTGSNYTQATCKISGDGTGLQITPLIDKGKIIRYDVINPGRNYTWCNIEIIGDGTGATAKVIYSPIKGHGFNAIDELNASTLMFYNTIKFKSTLGLTDTDYRQFGIIKNIKETNTGFPFQPLSGTALYKLKLSNSEYLNNDDILYLQSDPEKKLTVISTTADGYVYIQNTSGYDIAIGDGLLRESDAMKLRVISIILPEVNKMSGDLICIDNRAAIFQTSSQFISMRTTIKF